MAKSSYKSRESDSDEIKRKHSRRHRSKHESDSSYESDSDDHKSGRRHRSDKSRKSSGRHKKRRHSSPSSDSESEVSSGKSQSPRRKEPNEEEIVEYLAKKAYRKALKVAKKMKAPEVSGYSNDSNPFGDSNLTQKFVWKKKIEKDVAKDGVSSLKDLSVKAEKERQKRLMSEIEKVKKRREERALEKARREEEMAMLARERARAEFEDWEQKEEEFHFEQSKVRAEIRVNEGRAKPIDVLSKNLAAESFIEIAEPYEVFKGRSINEMLELRQDIKLHLELDRATPTHVEFWEAMLTVCDWEVSEARKRDALDRARVRGEEPAPELVAEDMGIHSSIAVDVEQRLGTMSFVELEKWQEKIESDMRTGSAKVVEYWEALLKRIHIFKAKARLREIHEGLRHKHLQQMQFSNSSEHQHKSIGLKVEHEEMLLEDPGLLSQIPEAGNAKEEEDNEAGSFSPELLHVHEGDEVVDPDLDKEELELRRARVLEEQQQRFQEAAGCSEDDSSKLTGQERALVLNAMGAMEEGDAILGSNSEVNLKAQIYWWHDKYRPRKPKYFNRVHTGYEWNKYNQTHYDHDNPPPKIVQGYKFNIFYPDLVDKSKTPTYYIERDGNSDETCMIRFHSGAPYEDIAFRIVNKEWEYSHKKGFKCTFERGILHLYFNFKRYRYRR